MTRSLPPIERYAASADERSMLKAFTDLEDKAGLGYVFHVHDAQGQRLTGLTDVLVILPQYLTGDGIVGFFELKTRFDRLSVRQRGVVNALDACSRVVSGIVRPHPHEGEISLSDALDRLGVVLS